MSKQNNKTKQYFFPEKDIANFATNLPIIWGKL